MQPLPDYNHSVVEQLQSLTAAGTLRADAAQLKVAADLDRILTALKRRAPARKQSALGWIFARKAGRAVPLKGLYVHGSVGRGKTMLMDMFFALAPVTAKRRCHFHDFMADVHSRVHAHRQKVKSGETREADPIPPVAAALLAEAELLCFDEFTVTDIADAMILARLFTALFANGCLLVATSNVVPGDLYKDGLNRGLFLPFVDLLQHHADVVTLDSPTDYRMEKDGSLPVYITPLDGAAEQAMDMAWHHLTAGKPVAPAEIAMKGRFIAVPRACGRIGRFSFADLCEKPLGAADFLAIAVRFDIVFVDRVPLLDAERRNETKRFILLIDTLYDQAVRLFISAAASPEKLLTQRKGTEGFEFDRTVSRLFEMRSGEYLTLHHERRAKL